MEGWLTEDRVASLAHQEPQRRAAARGRTAGIEVTCRNMQTPPWAVSYSIAVPLSVLAHDVKEVAKATEEESDDEVHPRRARYPRLEHGTRRRAPIVGDLRTTAASVKL